MTYPSAPWRMQGQGWLAMFKADQAIALPEPLKLIVPPTWMTMALLRYTAGTLQYDELILGRFARQGLKPGLHVDYIWVNDEQSLAGGRALWALPKQMAQFDWQPEQVRISDERGLIMTLAIPAPRLFAFPSYLPFPAIGTYTTPHKLIVARLTARMAVSPLHLVEWSDRFPFQLARQLSFKMTSFSAIFPPATQLHA